MTGKSDDLCILLLPSHNSEVMQVSSMHSKPRKFTFFSTSNAGYLEKFF